MQADTSIPVSRKGTEGSRGAGELCARRYVARLPFGSVNTGLPTLLRFVQIAFCDFGNPENAMLNKEFQGYEL